MNESTTGTTSSGASFFVFDRIDFPRLLDVLAGFGYRIIGPTVRSGAIVLDEVKSVGELPEGWGDEQKPGSYRLNRNRQPRLFGYSVGPHSWKSFLFPPRTLLWRASRSGGEFRIQEEKAFSHPQAFLGVRACELAAIRVQDRILEGVDPTYSDRRGNLFVVAVACDSAGGSCFCESMGTGPEPGPGFDLCLTEIVEEERHVFLVQVGSEQGQEVLDEMPHTPASPADIEAGAEASRRARRQMGRRIDTNGLKEILYRSYEHPRWINIAERCLACSNCTMVCPTCFCHTVEDTTDLTGNSAARWKTWDSCFITAFSRVAGGNNRASTRARYRQWMMHKLATWIDQFGTPGCVGCGRCITWCPARIDITEEAAIFRMTGAEAPKQETNAPAVLVETS